jgi:hypothetical protein
MLRLLIIITGLIFYEVDRACSITSMHYNRYVFAAFKMQDHFPEQRSPCVDTVCSSRDGMGFGSASVWARQKV